MEQHYEKITTHIQKWLHEDGDSELTNIFEIGMEDSKHSQGWQPDIKHVSQKWKKAVNAQNKIGWQQIYHGRIATEMITSMDQHYQQEGVHSNSKNGEQWARKLIKIIWDSMLSLWRERNNILNQRDEEIAKAHQKEAIEQRVQKCYAEKDNLRHAERIRWFSETMHDMLRKETKYLAAWAKTVERIINITKRERQKRPKESFIMERFLTLQPKISKNKSHIQKVSIQHPRKFSQELKPD
jgi:hypothetical protein